MRMKRAIIIPVLFLQIAAFAQDLNPTVTVTNTYQGEASGIVKPAQTISIPDSVSRFTLDFDYSVFESPYRGSYEFKPYSVQIRPRSETNKEGLLYVKAGAGYTLHPDLHVVYTPFSKPNFSLSVFSDHESYIGNYWNFKADGAGDISLLKDKDNTAAQAGRVGNSTLGTRLRYSWGSAELSAMAAWDNIFSSLDKGTKFGRLANTLDLETRLTSIDSNLDYDAFFSFKGGLDSYRYGSTSKMGSTELKAGGSIGTIELGIHGLSLGADMGMQMLSGAADAYSGYVALIPRDQFWLGNWHFDLGLRLGFLFSDDKTAAALYGETTHQAMFERKPQCIFPRVILSRGFAGDKFVFEAGVTGGEKYTSYWDFVSEHPFLASQSVEGAFLDNTIEKLNVFAGTRGTIADKFQLDFKAGYRMVANDLMWKAVDDGTGAPDMLPHLGWCSYNQLYSALDLEWMGDPVSAKVGVEAAYNKLLSADTFFAPAVLRGKSELKYHWGDRIRAGIRGSWQTSRTAVMAGGNAKIPGWCDLGLFGEFQWRRNIAFWLEGSNLLNQTIMTDPFVAQRGISCTAGVIFKL